jgi:hypothetical protein
MVKERGEETGLTEFKVPSDPRKTRLVHVDPRVGGCWLAGACLAAHPSLTPPSGKADGGDLFSPLALSWMPMHCADRQLPKGKCNAGSAHLMTIQVWLEGG